jgi:uncharacterized membrane protein
MEYLLIPLGCALASLKVTLQSKFSKSGKHTLSQNIFFTAIMFAVISLMFLPTLFDGGISAVTVFYAALLGSLSLLYQIFYVIALSMGRMTLTVIINNFGMLVPMLVSIFFLGDEFTPLIGVGAALALVSLCLTVANKSKSGDKSKNSGESVAWLILSILVFLTNGLASVAQKLYTARAGEDFQIFEFVCIAYLIAAIEAFAVFAFFLGSHFLGTRLKIIIEFIMGNAYRYTESVLNFIFKPLDFLFKKIKIKAGKIKGALIDKRLIRRSKKLMQVKIEGIEKIFISTKTY